MTLAFYGLATCYSYKKNRMHMNVWVQWYQGYEALVMKAMTSEKKKKNVTRSLLKTNPRDRQKSKIPKILQF